MLAECSPRPEVNVDVHSQKLDVQSLSIRSGLRGDPKYSSCVETKTHKKGRVLQCYCVTGQILYDVTQIAKSLKTLFFCFATKVWLGAYKVPERAENSLHGM